MDERIDANYRLFNWSGEKVGGLDGGGVLLLHHHFAWAMSCFSTTLLNFRTFPSPLVSHFKLARLFLREEEYNKKAADTLGASRNHRLLIR
jgi:hypothetical protein